MNATKWTVLEKLGTRTIWTRQVTTTGGDVIASYTVTRDVNGESVIPAKGKSSFGALRSARLHAQESDKAWDENGWDVR